jgi:HAMP domain-containing protein
MQDYQSVNLYSASIYKDIYLEFWILLAIVAGVSIILSLLIGFCVFRATKRITTPIEKLALLTQEIKKEHKIEEIRNKIKNHELFKDLVDKDKWELESNIRMTEQEIKEDVIQKSKNKDEIDELISNFYYFIVEVSMNKAKNDH